jgi:KaiC/GvpD/RAD55 family RecA-like ATPase
MYRDSIILVSGATGTGKTLMVSQYIKAAIEAGERALLFAAEESREQLTATPPAGAWTSSRPSATACCTSSAATPR